jgi:hypothetical protein
VTDELNPEQEAAVRRLLAQARHDGPVPDDVAARLDEVLDRLVADEGLDDLEIFADAQDAQAAPAAGTAPVTELAGVRQRRRTAGRLLLAAAAVVIGGVAVGQVVGNTSFEDAGSDADTAAEAPRDEAGGQDGGDAGADAAEQDRAPQAASGSLPTALLDDLEGPLSLTSDNFAADVQRQLGQTAAARRKAADVGYDGVRAYVAQDRDFSCAAGAYGEGATLPAYYDAEEAVLVLRRPRAGIQRVELLTCGTAVELNSVDLPAP